MRLATSGKGESQPVASNSSDSGRQANRRVEIYVEPVTQG
jgi:flagellar motor protein MotB